VARAIRRVPVANGLRWAFAPTEGLLAEFAHVIEAERRCCRFLRFAVAAEPDGGQISLEVTGPPGTAQFLDQLATGTAA